MTSRDCKSVAQDCCAYVGSVFQHVTCSLTYLRFSIGVPGWSCLISFFGALLFRNIVDLFKRNFPKVALVIDRSQKCGEL